MKLAKKILILTLMAVQKLKQEYPDCLERRHQQPRNSS